MRSSYYSTALQVILRVELCKPNGYRGSVQPGGKEFTVKQRSATGDAVAECI